MPVKSAQSRKIKLKKTPTSTPVIPIELEETEPVAVLEEKTEEELLTAEEESDELGLDDAGLEEELDPFNDKWEA